MPRSDTVIKAEERLQSLSARIDKLKSTRRVTRPAMRPETDGSDYDRAMDALAESWAAAERQFTKLQESGGEQWESMRSRFNGNLRRLWSLVQRVSETIELADGDEETGRNRYFISPSSDGGWMLKKQDIDIAT